MNCFVLGLTDAKVLAKYDEALAATVNKNTNFKMKHDNFVTAKC